MKLAGLRLSSPSDLPPTLWDATGCADCLQTGYRGRSGIYEFLAIDSSFQSAIVNDVDVPKLKELARERGFRPMLQDGINKALRGFTTVEEVLRVTQE